LACLLESEEWLKVVRLKRKGYTSREALKLIEKLVERRNQRDIRMIPDKSGR